jgi:hypothetical protein
MKKIFQILTNRYFLVTAFFLSWIFFFAENDLVTQYKQGKEYNEMKEKIKYIFIKLLDIVLLPLTYLLLPIYKLVKKYGVINFPLQVKAFIKTGIFPMQEPRI